MRRHNISLIAFLLVIFPLIISLTNPAWVFGGGNLYLIGLVYESDKTTITTTLEKLEAHGIPYATILRVKGDLPNEVLMAAGEEAFVKSFLSERGTISSQIDLRKVRLAVDILGMDRGIMARVFGYNYLFTSPHDCAISEPLFEALKKAYGKKLGDWIEAEVYTGESYMTFSCRVVGVFPEKNLMPSFIIATDKNYLRSFIDPVKGSPWFTKFTDEVILVYVDDINELEDVKKIVGCDNCLVPLG